ncbi:MAG TPA: SpoIID/LytB domain-containing protein [Candidatus Baltobacteraceae bacterium]|nr:SpoIID/LytB domain-containing protein [Candidatus Baltobacteraceae bacterium]
MITRRAFVCAALAAAATARARADEFDPAMNANAQELRVLLGPGVVRSASPGSFAFNGQTYRGTYSRLPGGSIVNTLRLEEYLYSVVPREMTPGWPDAALQAQAICARTYVLQRSNPARGYDVVPSELDQVYGGVAQESPAARAAVDASAGLVLRYGANFARVMYSSCCGGHTESASDAWGGAPIPYLGGVVCTTCTDSPYYRWNRTLDLTSVASAFANEIAPLGSLQSLSEGTRDPSGRARTIVLAGTDWSLPVKGSTFRLRIGPRVLPSLLITKFEPAAEAAGHIAIEGGGLGHGVGMCQWGARGLALRGAQPAEILNSYFPGTDIDHD